MQCTVWVLICKARTCGICLFLRAFGFAFASGIELDISAESHPISIVNYNAHSYNDRC